MVDLEIDLLKVSTFPSAEITIFFEIYMRLKAMENMFLLKIFDSFLSVLLRQIVTKYENLGT